MAFVSSPSSTNEVNTAYGVNTANTQVSPASTQVSTASTQVSTANLYDDIVYAFLASQPNGSQLVHEDLEQIHEDDFEVAKSIANYMADDEVPINMALMAFSDFENEVIFCEQLAVLKRDISYKDLEISMLKSELEKLKQEKESNQLKIEFDNASKRLFSPTKVDLSNSGLEEFQQPKFEGYGPKTSKSVSKDISNKVRESPDASLVKELVSDDKLEKKTIFPTVAKIEFVRPKQQEKPVRKPVKLTAITIKGKGWPNSTVVNAMRANQVNAVKASACWGHPQKEDQGYVDSGCSRHMTGNMSYLSNFKEFDRGYVTFRGGAK
ncbi:hypothetical protein Tco_0477295 [Tanacetum coccineum]